MAQPNQPPPQNSGPPGPDDGRRARDRVPASLANKHARQIELAGQVQLFGAELQRFGVLLVEIGRQLELVSRSAKLQHHQDKSRERDA